MVRTIAVEREEAAGGLLIVGVDVLDRFEFIELLEGPEGGADLDERRVFFGRLRREIPDERIDGCRDFRLLECSEELGLGSESVLAGVLRHIPLALWSLGAECQRRGCHIRRPCPICAAFWLRADPASCRDSRSFCGSLDRRLRRRARACIGSCSRSNPFRKRDRGGGYRTRS